jgi:hypothetical protein
MSRMLKLSAVFGFAMIAAPPAMAGQSCEKRAADPAQTERAARAANAAISALDQHRDQIAIIARVGQDLSAQGLVYSHAGFVLKTDQGWRVTHLLNECGTDEGALYQEGMIDFFAQNPHRYQSKIVWLPTNVAEPIRLALQAHHGKAVFQPRYNVIARPYSQDRQNSTAWLLEVLAASQNPLPDSRDEARLVLQQTGYQPDQIRISYGKRIAGGLFKANAVFTDHPMSTRLSGKYPVTTVRSIFRYLDQRGWVRESNVQNTGSMATLQGD